SEAEIAAGILDRNIKSLKSGAYISGVESVKMNFSEWKNVRIIPGAIPDTLKEVEAEHIAYLHLDMNNSAPEVAALEFFWDRLSPGAIVLMDDYTYHGFRSIKSGHDAFAKRKNLMIASLPTGQGILIKPAC
ncbi:MAG: class I SAM-dependent methyltransferase, partial [candidate division Zixibacteria bacterium]|nr:class I SAM-dependent methyltransferase [candidate division Zixibacteria bacterium]